MTRHWAQTGKRSERMYEVCCTTCTRDFMATSSATRYCPECEALRERDKAERKAESKRSDYARVRAKRRAMRSRFVYNKGPKYTLIKDTSAYACLPGLGLTLEEVRDPLSWADGTQFWRKTDKVILEWRGGYLVEVLCSGGASTTLTR